MRRRTRLGFSFIEVLVVMGIIAVLVGGVMVGVASVLEQQRRLETTHAVDKAALLVEDWHRSFDRYPPSAMMHMERVLDDPSCTVHFAGGVSNETNDGIETVYQALLWPGFDGRPDWQHDQVGNTDGDRLEKPVNSVGTVELHEILDAYGNPLVYFAGDDYARFAEGGALYWTAAAEVEPRPHRTAEGTFARPLSFQVYSMGPDGLPNTDDDIGNWSR